MEPTHFIEQYKTKIGSHYFNGIRDICHLEGDLRETVFYDFTTIAIFKIKYK